MSGKQKILIVDDRQENLFVLATTLKETQAEIIKATNGNDALTASLNHDFALAVLDVQMPEMDGYELAEHLISGDRTKHIPIIFLTAYADEKQMFKGYDIGAVDYIVKPYDPVVLLSKVLAFLELDRQRSEIQDRKNRLEEIVEERTLELTRLNAQLRREISERKRAEAEVRKLNDGLEILVGRRTAQLEAVNKELEAFAYSVSHDLRAPLRAVEGFSRALTENYEAVLDKQGKDYLNKVSGEAGRMNRLIQDLLNLSRITRTEMRFQTVDLTGLTLDIVDMLQQGEPSRRVAVAIAEDLRTHGDPNLLRQLFENLLGNAWKFTGRREDAEIEVGSFKREGHDVYFVRDNGAGFNMEYADKLFVPFQRLHGTAEFSGTGVGLSTVQRIVTRHGGRVWAEGTEGRGAAFFFTIEEMPQTKEL